MFYNLLFSNPLSLISYLLLLISILSLWIKQDIKVWGVIAAFSMVCGVISDRIAITGIASILILGLLYYTVNRIDLKLPVRATVSVLAIILSVLLATHFIPGFNNWKIIDNVSLSEISQSYSMYLNMDKTFVGLIILGLGFPLVKNLKEWVFVLRSALPIFLMGLIVLAFISPIFNYIRWDLKFPNLVFVWALNNLFFTCVSEKTQRIEASILCHFGVNIIHFIFFTYPALANT